MEQLVLLYKSIRADNTSINQNEISMKQAGQQLSIKDV